MSPIIVDFSYAGMTVGTIAVREIASAVKTQHNASSDFIVTDAQNTVIATSLPFVLPLQRFTYIEQRHPLVRSVLGLRIGDRHYLYHQLSNQYGWQIFTLTSPSEATAEMMGNFYILLLCAGLLLIFFALIANQLSNKITKPLEKIAEHFPDKVLHPKVLEDAKISKEIVTLTQRLINSHSVVNDFQHQLKEQVEHKTRQLKQLNKELYSLAQKDGLTQLLNRAGFNRLAISSYRNCMRNRIKMSLILIDIDHFKLINDTHGHPFGDKCIKHVAKVLQHHCKRDTDIIGRFGGEEFIIMITGGEIFEHHERMQLIKDSIAQSVFRQNEKDVLMTVSAGILSISKDFTIDFESMIKLADDQLYFSKRTGRNKISILSR
jgi:diguanylate cyclase (GGDEF)-like protein